MCGPGGLTHTLPLPKKHSWHSELQCHTDEHTECKECEGGRTGEDMCQVTPEEGEVFGRGKLCTPPEIPNAF